MAISKQNQGIIWSNARNRKFNGYLPLGRGRFGGDTVTKPGPGRETTFTVGDFSQPELAVVGETPPGGLPSVTVTFFEQYDPNVLRQARDEQRKVSLQVRWVESGVLSNPFSWKKLTHMGEAGFGDQNFPFPPLEYAGAGAQGSEILFPEIGPFEYFRPTLTAQTAPAQVADALDVHFISDIIKGVPAYPGPDRVGFIAMGAATGVAAKLLCTKTGGSTWENADADPFGADEDIAAVRTFVINPRVGGRVVVLNADAAELAYADYTWADPTALTWTTVAVTGNGKALGWNVFTELLIATASGVFLSDDAGESIEATLSSNANVTDIFYAPSHPDLTPYAYLVGASNTILRKKEGSNTVDVMAGPSGGAAFRSGSVALDGTIYAGNGTKLYRSDDGATEAAGWTEIRDYGTSHAAVGINTVRGDSEVLEVVVDDATPGASTVEVSADAKTFEDVTVVAADDGTNAVYFSPHQQFAILVGDDDTAAPVVQKLAAA